MAARLQTVAQFGPAPLSLTRRGRVVIVVAALILICVVLSILRMTASQAGAGMRTAVVQPGDTLWSVASALEPEHDPRVVVAQIEAMNHLDTSQLVPGMQLRLPG